MMLNMTRLKNLLETLFPFDLFLIKLRLFHIKNIKFKFN